MKYITTTSLKYCVFFMHYALEVVLLSKARVTEGVRQPESTIILPGAVPLTKPDTANGSQNMSFLNSLHSS